jgi:hypothetical protein
MVRPWRTIVLGAAGSLSTALLIAGCGGDSPPSNSSLPTTASAAQSADSAPSPSSAAATSAADLAERMAAAIRATPTARVTMSASDGSLAADGQVDLSAGDPRVMMTISAAGQDLQLIMLPDGVYVSADHLGSPGTWLSVAADGDDPVSRSFGDVLGQLTEGLDPGSSASTYALATAFSVEGRETVGGVETTRYRVEFDDAALAAGPPDEPGGGSPAPTTGGMTAVTDIYLGADDLPRRIVTARTTATTDFTIEIAYSDWGEPVQIEAPAPAAVQTPQP